MAVVYLRCSIQGQTTHPRSGSTGMSGFQCCVCALYCVAVVFDPFGHEVTAPEELHFRLLRLVVVQHVEANLTLCIDVRVCQWVLVVLRDALVELVVLLLGGVPLDTQPDRLLRVLLLPGPEAALYLQSSFCTTLSGLLPQGIHVRVQGLP